MPFYCGKRSARIVLGSKNSSTYSTEYASGFFEPAALHLPAAPMPRNEGLLGQTPSVFRHRMDISKRTVSELEASPIGIETVIL